MFWVQAKAAVPVSSSWATSGAPSSAPMMPGTRTLSTRKSLAACWALVPRQAGPVQLLAACQAEASWKAAGIS